MHPNRAFRQIADNDIIGFVRARSFGVLTLAGTNQPLASHLPFVLNGDATRIEAHVVRSNPIAPLLRDTGPDGAEALLIVSGPDGYVSPDWYGIDDQVPTWNYVAVHVRGRVHQAPDDEIVTHLETLSAQFETRLAGKAPWRLDKLSDGKLASLAGMISKIRMEIGDMTGTWKLSQNKPDAARHRAAGEMQRCDVGSETEKLARLMSGWAPA